MNLYRFFYTKRGRDDHDDYIDLQLPSDNRAIQEKLNMQNRPGMLDIHVFKIGEKIA